MRTQDEINAEAKGLFESIGFHQHQIKIIQKRLDEIDAEASALISLTESQTKLIENADLIAKGETPHE